MLVVNLNLKQKINRKDKNFLSSSKICFRKKKYLKKL